MDCQKVIRLTWQDAWPSLRPAIGDHESALIEEAEQGILQCVRIGKMHFALRAELLDGKTEVVVVLAAGQGLRAAARTLKRMVAASGGHTIRIHNSLPGIQRILAEHDPKEVERVYRIKV